MKLITGTFSNSYQEIMLTQLINEHFEKEQEGFLREGTKIKIISLVFIDSISSYRDNGGWLRTTFEEILKSKVDELIQKYENFQDDKEKDYLNYLIATRSSLSSEIQEVHGGYFAADWGEADDSAIAEERRDILEKERTLTFKKEDGSWNLRRFFFSKWTLREGWDNPNVFVIAKLRSSGSEISKLQEVGRGLRLPVDENGKRLGPIYNEDGEALYLPDHRLSYIIDFSEREFAGQLIGEINAQVGIQFEIGQEITDEIVEILIKVDYGKSKREVQNKLADAGILDDDLKIIDADGLQGLLPSVNPGKITTGANGKKVAKTVKLKQENWQKIKDFWSDVSKRYMIRYEEPCQEELEGLIGRVFNKIIFPKPQMTVVREEVRVKENKGMMVRERESSYESKANFGKLTFGEFLKRFAEFSKLPIPLFYDALIQKFKIYGAEAESYINQSSLSLLQKAWDFEFKQLFGSRHSYDALSYSANTSILKNGDFVEELASGMIGTNEVDDVSGDARNLFEYPPAFYDSSLEHEIMQENPSDKVVVFGKVPRRAIQVPTFTGGTTTPDFVYVSNNQMRLLVEAKADDLRTSEELAIDAQEQLFKKIPNTKWIKVTKVEDVREALEQLE